MKLIDLNIKPFEAAGLNHNVVRVSVSYDKSSTGPIANIQTAEVGEPEFGFSSFKVAIFGSPSSRVVIEKGWKTKNVKKVSAVRDRVLVDIIAKRGEIYEAIEKLLAANGSEIVELAVA